MCACSRPCILAGCTIKQALRSHACTRSWRQPPCPPRRLLQALDRDQGQPPRCGTVRGLAGGPAPGLQAAACLTLGCVRCRMGYKPCSSSSILLYRPPSASAHSAPWLWCHPRCSSPTHPPTHHKPTACYAPARVCYANPPQVPHSECLCLCVPPTGTARWQGEPGEPALTMLVGGWEGS